MSDFLLRAWQSACEELDIEQSVDRLARLVAGRSHADVLVVRRLDVERARIETVTVAPCRPGARVASAPVECTPDQLNRVLAWGRTGQLVRRRSGAGQPLIELIVPAGADGEWIAGPLSRHQQPIGILLLGGARTMTSADESIVQMLLAPVSAALANSWRVHELARVREAIEADNRALLSRLDRDALADTVVGADAGLRPVLERVRQVAPTDAPVLIVGETGTGKEVLARAIHGHSKRASGPVVRVNCGALPPGLIDSELFGHERGSFTGAISPRRGWFERADGGTLFLDEVGELPLDAQVRLLRILQDGTFERVGGHKSLTVDVRIVAATHRDLQDMVARGGFREDLWYRISVFPIHLPPLRDRVEDIPALAAHFAWRAGKRLGGGPLTPSPADLDLLAVYAWPGNVRELASVIERAAILGNGRELKVAAALGGASPRGGRQRADSIKGVTIDPASIATLDAVVIRHIELALRAADGRIEGGRGAAARLGINPHTLRARMRKLGIDWTRFRERPASRSRAAR